MKKHFQIIFLAIIFFAVFLSLKCKDEPTQPQPSPLPDTTSHAIQWQTPDTLGAQGFIRDVWVFSKNNAWAVGEIYLNDSTGKPDMGNPYNAAHWDGSKWGLMRIWFYTICGQQSRTAYPANSIFAFSPTDIWILPEIKSHIGRVILKLQQCVFHFLIQLRNCGVQVLIRYMRLATEVILLITMAAYGLKW